MEADYDDYVNTFTKKELKILYGISYRKLHDWIIELRDFLGEEALYKRSLEQWQIEVLFKYKRVPWLLREIKRQGMLAEYFQNRVIRIKKGNTE